MWVTDPNLKRPSYHLHATPIDAHNSNYVAMDSRGISKTPKYFLSPPSVITLVRCILDGSTTPFFADPPCAAADDQITEIPYQPEKPLVLIRLVFEVSQRNLAATVNPSCFVTEPGQFTWADSARIGQSCHNLRPDLLPGTSIQDTRSTTFSHIFINLYID